MCKKISRRSLVLIVEGSVDLPAEPHNTLEFWVLLTPDANQRSPGFRKQLRNSVVTVTVAKSYISVTECDWINEIMSSLVYVFRPHQSGLTLPRRYHIIILADWLSYIKPLLCSILLAPVTIKSSARACICTDPRRLTLIGCLQGSLYYIDTNKILYVNGERITKWHDNS
jgi:hypothetical protein